MSEIEQEKDEIASRVPTLQLRRLRVLKSGRPVYDQAFHEGVNIIRGDNGVPRQRLWHRFEVVI